MKNLDWTKKELEAYVLIYCANADFIEHEEEIDYIKLKVDEVVYKKMHKVFTKNNDFQSLQQIEKALAELNYTAVDKVQLLEEVRELFNSDDSFSINEQNLLRGLQHIFK